MNTAIENHTDNTSIRVLLRNRIIDRVIFMKGIDCLYYYENDVI